METSSFWKNMMLFFFNWPQPPSRSFSSDPNTTLIKLRQLGEALAQNVAARCGNHLMQSILAKAFRGELTEQWRTNHLDLIQGENSAEALLARIKTERANLTPKKKTRGKK